jgi:amphi-Trp domain-containing protein
MSEERTIYESETKRSLPEVVDFLQQLAQWLSEGQLTVDKGDEPVVIEIPSNVVLEIEIEEEDEGEGQVKRSLEIEIEWTEEREISAAVEEARAAVGDEAEDGAQSEEE